MKGKHLLEHPTSNWKHKDKPSNGKACLERDGISYVELIRFSIDLDSHTNGIESFFPPSRLFVVVLELGQRQVEHAVAVDEDDYFLELQPSSQRPRAFVAVAAAARVRMGEAMKMTMISKSWAMPIVGRMPMLV